MSGVNDISEAYQNVFQSSKQIIDNNQRDLYINMLDLLCRTTNAATLKSKKILTNEIVKFWLTDILNLVFDDDLNIQRNAISSMELIFTQIDPNIYQNMTEWPEIRTNMVQLYAKKLHYLRNSGSDSWYKIWCLIIRILNQEIIKSTSIINTFLSVVEEGFRSNNQVRAEAFISWKVLIEVFAANNELLSTKRVNLISIPLRSSHAKTERTALNKFKAWWYFIVKLRENEQLMKTSDLTFEPFLCFCFAKNVAGREGCAQSQIKSYSNVKEMAVVALIEMLGASKSENRFNLEKFELEKCEHTIITTDLLKKYAQLIIKAVYDATFIIIEQFSTTRKKNFEILWRNLFDQIVAVDSPDSFEECCIVIRLLIQADLDKPELVIKDDIKRIIKILGTNHKFLPTFDNRLLDVEQVSRKIICFTNIFLNYHEEYFPDYDEIISHIYAIETFSVSVKYWDVLRALMKNLLSDKGDSVKSNVMVTLSIWKKLSNIITKYLKDKLFEFRAPAKAHLLNSWILWPLEKYHTSDLLDEDLMKHWKQIVLAAATAVGRANFLKLFIEPLKVLCNKRDEILNLNEIICIYILCVERDFEEDSYPFELFELLKLILNNQNSKNCNYNKIIDEFAKYISELQPKQIDVLFEDLISITKLIQSSEKSKQITKTCLDSYKKTVQEILEKKCSLNKLKAFKQALKSNDEFVIIPNIWTMNPDRLTEHQKEKMKERKNDLPALYNDMSSHSQDVHSLKPWTPNKIVIAKSKDTEEIFLPGSENVTIPSPSLIKMFETLSSNDQINLETDFLAKKLQENKNGEKMEPRLNKQVNESKESTPKTKEKTKRKTLNISRKDEALLKNMKVDTTDNKKVLKVLKQFRQISIDTIEGNVLLRSRGERNLPMRKTRKMQKQGKIDLKSHSFSGTESQAKQNNRSKKSANLTEYGNKIQENASTDDEVVQASQQHSESMLARRAKKHMTHIKSVSNKSSVAKKEKLRQKALSPVCKIDALSDKLLQRSSLNNVEGNLQNKEKDGEENNSNNSHGQLEIINEGTLRDPNTNIKKSSKLIRYSSLENLPLEHGLKANESKTKEYDLFMEHSTTKETACTMEDVEPVSDDMEKNLADAETQLNTDFMFLNGDDVIVKNSPVKRASPRKRLTYDEKFETENLTNFEQDERIYDFMEEFESKHISSTKKTFSPYQTILSSPVNCAELTQELLDETLNISPIKTTIENNDGNILESVNQPVDSVGHRTSVLNNKIITKESELETSPNSKLTPKSSANLPSSPPNRKSTNNYVSPTVKPKSYLNGRGAQLINMIRNRSTNNGCNLTSLSKTDCDNLNPQKKNFESTNSPTKNNFNDIPNFDSVLKTPQPSDLLTFSKVLPSPYASPSTSILKRKFANDSEDNDSPAKRKKVSFSDPPVSIRKEYVLQPEENKSTNSVQVALHKLLHPEKTSTPEQLFKHFLKRKSRVDSMLEIAKFNENSSHNKKPADISVQTETNLKTEKELNDQTCLEMDNIKWKNITSEASGGNINELQNSEELPCTPTLIFQDEKSCLEYILQKYSLNEIIENYVEKCSSTSFKSMKMSTTHLMVKEISNSMELDPKIKAKVLETLSENHPKEFLDHAIQENLSSVVCDRLSSTAVINYVFEKSKINAGYRKTVMGKISDILQMDKFMAEKLDLVETLLSSRLEVNNEEILNYIQILIQQRLTKHTTAL